MGGIQRLSQEEIYGLAEQVLAGLLSWDELKHLDSEDRSRIKVLVDRGPRSLGEGQGHVRLKKHQRMATSRQPHGLTQTVFIPLEKIKPDFHSLIQHIPLPALPTQALFGAENSLLKRWSAFLLCGMKEAGLAAYLNTFPPEHKQTFLEQLNPQRAKQLKESSPSDKQQSNKAALTQASLLTLRFLKEEEALSEELQLCVKHYCEELEESILIYCRSLPEGLGLSQSLKRFSDRQWQQLAGITPRSDMAQLADVLEAELFSKLTAPLPKRQIRDLEEDIAFCREQRKRNLERCSDLIQALRSWATLVEKAAQITY